MRSPGRASAPRPPIGRDRASPRTSGSGRSSRSTVTRSAAFARKRRRGTASQAPRARAAPASRGVIARPTPTVACMATTALSLREGKRTWGYALIGPAETPAPRPRSAVPRSATGYTRLAAANGIAASAAWERAMNRKPRARARLAPTRSTTKPPPAAPRAASVTSGTKSEPYCASESPPARSTEALAANARPHQPRDEGREKDRRHLRRPRGHSRRAYRPRGSQGGGAPLFRRKRDTAVGFEAGQSPGGWTTKPALRLASPREVGLRSRLR